MNTEHKNILEALLFASADPLSTKALHERMPDGADVGALLLELQEEYSDRGVRLVEADRSAACSRLQAVQAHVAIGRSGHQRKSRDPARLD